MHKLIAKLQKAQGYLGIKFLLAGAFKFRFYNSFNKQKGWKYHDGLNYKYWQVVM